MKHFKQPTVCPICQAITVDPVNGLCKQCDARRRYNIRNVSKFMSRKKQAEEAGKVEVDCVCYQGFGRKCLGYTIDVCPVESGGECKYIKPKG